MKNSWRRGNQRFDYFVNIPLYYNTFLLVLQSNICFMEHWTFHEMYDDHLDKFICDLDEILTTAKNSIWRRSWSAKSIK